MNLMNILIAPSNNQWSSTSNIVTQQENTLAAVMGTLIVIGIIALVLGILTLIAMYKIAEKMGYEGWKGLIPVVNAYLMMEKMEVSAKWLVLLTFGSLIACIPFIGWLVLLIVCIYFSIIFSISLARSFGKSDGFGVGLLLLCPIFICILGFGKSEFVGANPMNDAIFGKKEPSSPLATPIGSSENKDNNTVEPMVESMEEKKPVEPVMTTEQAGEPETPVMDNEPVVTTEPTSEEKTEDTL